MFMNIQLCSRHWVGKREVIAKDLGLSPGIHALREACKVCLGKSPIIFRDKSKPLHVTPLPKAALYLALSTWLALQPFLSALPLAVLQPHCPACHSMKKSNPFPPFVSFLWALFLHVFAWILPSHQLSICSSGPSWLAYLNVPLSILFNFLHITAFCLKVSYLSPLFSVSPARVSAL